MQRSADVHTEAGSLARAELIGRSTRVAVSNDPTLLGLEGTVVDETMHTFTLTTGGHRRTVAKPGQRFAFEVDGSPVLLDGNDITYRPEDRIKKAKVER